LGKIHAAFAAARNSGVMEWSKGVRAWRPGMASSDACLGSSAPAIATLLPVAAVPVAAVPVPAHRVLAATALIGLFARRRRAAASA